MAETCADARIAVNVLNRLLEADRPAMTALVNLRVPANKALEDDPTAQCGSLPLSQAATIGLVGVLNALFGTTPTGQGRIMVQCDPKTGEVEYFMLVT